MSKLALLHNLFPGPIKMDKFFIDTFIISKKLFLLYFYILSQLREMFLNKNKKYPFVALKQRIIYNLHGLYKGYR